ncbi:HAMP domain-containing sensor histidine kinase [Clostridium sp.]|uniref:sensor histidine kinase n=1 Tax=Clostridium sp. TaxID=1506 RepID=UPI0032167A6E
MLNRFIKKSVASKLFLMNLLILICIVVSQLIFQALYFEKYYLDKKESKLENTLKDFKEFLLEDVTKEEVMDFMQEVKRNDNIALSFKNSSLTDGITLAPYMGQNKIIIKDKANDKRYKVVLGEQFPEIMVNKGDIIQAYGNADEYGYLCVQEIRVNGEKVEPYYNIIPSEIIESSDASVTSPASVVPLGGEKYIEGKVEEVIPKDNTYLILSNADAYLNMDEKQNILSNDKYVTKTNTINGADDILVYSEKFLSGYIIAIAQLTEVNDVIGTMNSYYFIIFIVAFLIVVVISLIYSRFMTKPLVEMSDIASKISECDFQYKYDVKREDEIGVLGNSLNLISSNLEKSLSELQTANEKLKNEMDIKEVQEEKRKELIANISHELKTPITIIQGNITGIKSGMYTVDMYEDILEETNKMNELVREMLEISKLESPSFNLKKEPFDLGSVFLKEKDNLKGLIKEKFLEINHNDFDDVIVFGDEKRINQVVTNLLTNAIKYTPDGSKVNVSIELIEDKDQYVFSIENFGVTLSKDELDKIWDAFYRKEKSRNKKFGGTGLGLSIVKRILEVHNSDFGVESTQNSVRFYFSIPKCMSY